LGARQRTGTRASTVDSILVEELNGYVPMVNNILELRAYEDQQTSDEQLLYKTPACYYIFRAFLSRSSSTAKSVRGDPSVRVESANATSPSLLHINREPDNQIHCHAKSEEEWESVQFYGEASVKFGTRIHSLNAALTGFCDLTSAARSDKPLSAEHRSRIWWGKI
jgi:hypothetical protein